MGRKRLKDTVRRRTPGGRVDAELYERVVARCRDLRVKREVWRIGTFTEIAYELLMAFSPPVQREMLELHEMRPGFWRELEPGIRESEPELLRLLQCLRQDSATGGRK